MCEGLLIFGETELVKPDTCFQRNVSASGQKIFTLFVHTGHCGNKVSQFLKMLKMLMLRAPRDQS